MTDHHLPLTNIPPPVLVNGSPRRRTPSHDQTSSNQSTDTMTENTTTPHTRADEQPETADREVPR